MALGYAVANPTYFSNCLLTEISHQKFQNLPITKGYGDAPIVVFGELKLMQLFDNAIYVLMESRNHYLGSTSPFRGGYWGFDNI